MSDPNPQGGSLTDMAVEGTHVDPTAATPRTIPSKPNPHQMTEQSDLGAPDIAGAADNAGDISRVRFPPPFACSFAWHEKKLTAHTQTTRDNAPTGDVITGTGDALPAEVGSKRLHNVAQGDVSKGSVRYDKHVAQKSGDQLKGASEGGEEEPVVEGVVGGR